VHQNALKSQLHSITKINAQKEVACNESEWKGKMENIEKGKGKGRKCKNRIASFFC
jgi:hypothetical protein